MKFYDISCEINSDILTLILTTLTCIKSFIFFGISFWIKQISLASKGCLLAKFFMQRLETENRC